MHTHRKVISYIGPWKVFQGDSVEVFEKWGDARAAARRSAGKNGIMTVDAYRCTIHIIDFARAIDYEKQAA